MPDAALMLVPLVVSVWAVAIVVLVAWMDRR